MTSWSLTWWETGKRRCSLLSVIRMRLLCAQIGHFALQIIGTVPHDNAGGRLPDRKAKADTGTQHGRKAVSCPKAIGYD